MIKSKQNKYLIFGTSIYNQKQLKGPLESSKSELNEHLINTETDIDSLLDTFWRKRN